MSPSAWLSFRVFRLLVYMKLVRCIRTGLQFKYATIRTHTYFRKKCLGEIFSGENVWGEMSRGECPGGCPGKCPRPSFINPLVRFLFRPFDLTFFGTFVLMTFSPFSLSTIICAFCHSSKIMSQVTRTKNTSTHKRSIACTHLGISIAPTGTLWPNIQSLGLLGWKACRSKEVRS